METIIDIVDLHPGCREPDCIPSIDTPKWLVGSQAFDENNNDVDVLGMIIIDDNQIVETFVFPIIIMDLHEIVNFKTSIGVPVAMTYCPLCQTATAYERMLNGNELILGVSGLLFNSALVIYDRESMSLFSQVWSKGIVGKYSGEHLPQIPLIQTTLSSFLTVYPEAKVLSKDTGFPKRQKRYESNHYHEYKTSEKIHFPVRFTDELMHPKDLVYIIELEDQVYILSQENSDQIIHDLFYSLSHAGGRLFFHGRKLDDQNHIPWEKWIPSGISYYFAARAYFPDALLIV
ncbi:MAG: DUF3179 domain-containing (seleno)protein [Candidatus Kariarchaeaceae archaeon]